MELTPFSDLIQKETAIANSFSPPKNDNFDFTSKYEPTSFEDFIGNKTALQTLLNWIESPTETASILFAPSGVGKSLIIKLITKQYKKSDTLEIVDLTYKDDKQIEDLILGKEQTCTILDLFKDDPLRNKKPKLFVIDNADAKLTSDKEYISKIQKKMAALKNKHNRLFCTASINMIKKLNKIKHVKLFAFTRVENKDLKTFVNKIIRLERKRSSEDFGDHVYSQSNGDVRATLKNLEILLVKKSRNIVMTRDQDMLVTDVAEKLLYYTKNNVKDEPVPDINFKEKLYMSETDTYSLVYSIHENFPTRLKNIDDISTISDDLSFMDFLKGYDNSFDTVFDAVFGAVYPSQRIKHSLTEKETSRDSLWVQNKKDLRPYKIISSSNQRIISKNKADSAARNLKIYNKLPYTELLEIVKIIAVKNNCRDDYSWFFNRFSNKKKTPKKDA